MRLKLKYGTDVRDVAESSVVINRQETYSDNEKRTGYIETWTISGFLQADTQAALSADILALETAYSVDNKTAVLLFEDNTETAHKLDTNGSVSGVRVRAGVDYPVGKDAQYSTFRSYSIAIDAEYATDVGILFSQESLNFTGGGLRFLHKQTLTGFAQKQIVAQNIPHRVTQTGFAVGHFAWPLPNAPMFPQHIKNDESSVTRSSPEKIYGRGQNATHYRIDWSYSFENISAMNGNPSF